jgi:hypothetical protein
VPVIPSDHVEVMTRVRLAAKSAWGTRMSSGTGRGHTPGSVAWSCDDGGSKMDVRECVIDEDGRI